MARQRRVHYGGFRWTDNTHNRAVPRARLGERDTKRKTKQKKRLSAGPPAEICGVRLRPNRQQYAVHLRNILYIIIYLVIFYRCTKKCASSKSETKAAATTYLCNIIHEYTWLYNNTRIGIQIMYIIINTRIKRSSRDSGDRAQFIISVRSTMRSCAYFIVASV